VKYLKLASHVYPEKPEILQAFFTMAIISHNETHCMSLLEGETVSGGEQGYIWFSRIGLV